jgi:RNA polymerase sigma-70 factor (ECF subfamily)
MDVHPTDAGSSRAATLWGQFAAPLRSFVGKRAPREVDTDDVLQDVFVRIQEQLPNLRDADRIDAWIFQIARNVVADAYRRRARVEAVTDRGADAEAAPAQESDERTAEVSLASCLASMIAQLPEPYREAIELTEIRGLTQLEAARRTGISISGMKSRVQRGRAHLKRIIHDVCRVETDVRGGVIECDPRPGAACGDGLRPLEVSRDSMDMNQTDETKTGSDTSTQEAAKAGCCGGPAANDASACCALDADVKASGGTGCGCATKAAAAAPTKSGCC